MLVIIFLPLSAVWIVLKWLWVKLNFVGGKELHDEKNPYPPGLFATSKFYVREKYTFILVEATVIWLTVPNTNTLTMNPFSLPVRSFFLQPI